MIKIVVQIYSNFPIESQEAVCTVLGGGGGGSPPKRPISFRHESYPLTKPDKFDSGKHWSDRGDCGSRVGKIITEKVHYYDVVIFVQLQGYLVPENPLVA